MKLLQIIRSSPSIIAPLIGQKKMDHVNKNNKISEIPPLSEEEFNAVLKYSVREINNYYNNGCNIKIRFIIYLENI